MKTRTFFLSVMITTLVLAQFNPTVAQGDKKAVQDSLANKYHLSELPNFNYGKGIGMISPDSTFRLNIRFRMQNRLVVSSFDNSISSVEARIRRLRLKFDGWVFNPRLSYAIELAFSRRDIRPLPGSPPNIINDAIILYKVTKQFSLGFGQTKLPGNRQRVISSGNIQLVDRSIANGIFNIDRDFGGFIYYSNQFSDNFYYRLRGAITTGEGRNWTENTSNGLSYTGRIELLPLGEFTNKGDYFEGDLEREPNPKLAIGLSYNYNDNAVRTAGQRGREMWDNKNLTHFMADIIFKYRGMAFEAEYLQRKTNNPISINPENANEQLFVYKGSGVNFQMSYLLPKNYEIAGRYTSIIPDEEIRSLTDKIDNYIIGFSKYIRGHTLKIQSDLIYSIKEEMNTGIKNNYFEFRFQIELGI